MGGSGGGSYYSANDVGRMREEAKKRFEQNRIDAQVNSILENELTAINDRDVDRVNERLDEIKRALGTRAEALDRLLFGGSVAKNTYVDGLSDVDCLVVLNDESLIDKAPADVLQEFREGLLRALPQGEIEDIRVGRLAVTVDYLDGTEIQLLPAVQSGGGISIAAGDGQSWSQIRPRDFAQSLTECNQNQGGAVVPAVKLAKAVLAKRLGETRPSGYHVESLAVDAFRDYMGSRTPKAMLTRFFDYSWRAVLRPVVDVTGQSRYVDDYLGLENSSSRAALSRALRHISKVMLQSGSVTDWQALLE